MRLLWFTFLCLIVSCNSPKTHSGTIDRHNEGVDSISASTTRKVKQFAQKIKDDSVDFQYVKLSILSKNGTDAGLPNVVLSIDELITINKLVDSVLFLDNEQIVSYKNANERYFLSVILMSFFLTLVFVWIIVSGRKRNLKQKSAFIEQLQYEVDYKERQLQEVTQQNLSKISTLNSSLEEKERLAKFYKDSTEERYNNLKKLIVLKYQFESNPDKFFKEFSQIVAFNKKTTTECQKFVGMVNLLNNNIIERANKIFNLNSSDEVMLSLLCFDFSALEMSLFLDKSLGATYTARSRLYEKLGVKSIEELKESMKG